MVGRREPVDRVVDLLVAAPTCTIRAARRAMPLVADVVRRGLVTDPPDDHRRLPVGDAGSEGSSTADAAVESAPPVADAVPDVVLPIDEYDHLAARQVVDRLGGLEPAELDTVAQYERANRHRQTILRRIEQLRS